MYSMLLLPIIPAAILGTLNWLYWRKKGYTSAGQLILGIIVFYGIFYMLFKVLK